jgi:hypothetical protein
MNEDFTEITNALRGHGWVVQERQERAALPRACAERYSWLPEEAIAFVAGFDAVVAPSQCAWLITCAELSGESDSAFAWDQWEQDSW